MCAVFLLGVFPFTLPVHADNPYVVSAPDRAIAGYQPARDTPLDMLDSTAHWSNILNGFSDGVRASWSSGRPSAGCLARNFWS